MESHQNIKKRSLPALIRVLYLDDNPYEIEEMKKALTAPSTDWQFEFTGVANANNYWDAFTQIPDVVILDINLNSSDNGIDLIPRTRELGPNVVILMRSAASDIASVKDSLNSGADDFLAKQSDTAEIGLRVWNSYRLARMKRGADLRKEKRAIDHARRPFMAIGKTMDQIARRIPLLIKSAVSSIHVQGESGVGKEVVADLLESQLPPSTPFVRVNCGAIAPSLLESELFGHVKGAFTGATSEKRGLIEAASGGWIFFDEIATLTPSAQIALLRVLENQEVLRVGSTVPIRVEVRILSATNELLGELVKGKKFRGDLVQRLCETEINLSPLRDRSEEIESLVLHFCKTMPGGPYDISVPAREILKSLQWKSGNIRELRNCLRAMTELHVNRLLTPISIPEKYWSQDDKNDPPLQSVPQGSMGVMNVKFDLTKTTQFDALSEQLLLTLIRHMAAKQGVHSIRQLARTLSLSRGALSQQLKNLTLNGLIEPAELDRLLSSKGTV